MLIWFLYDDSVMLWITRKISYVCILTCEMFLYLFNEVFFIRAFKAYYIINVRFSMVLLHVTMLSAFNVLIPYVVLSIKV